MDYLTHLVVDTGWNGDISFNPWHMCDNRDFSRGEEVLAEMSTLGIVPGEAFILQYYEVVH